MPTVRLQTWESQSIVQGQVVQVVRLYATEYRLDTQAMSKKGGKPRPGHFGSVFLYLAMGAMTSARGRGLRTFAGHMPVRLAAAGATTGKGFATVWRPSLHARICLLFSSCPVRHRIVI